MTSKPERVPHICIVCCQHVPDDVRVTHKIGMAFRQAGFRVTWVGPERPRTGDDYGIRFVYYPLRPGRRGRLLRVRDALAAARAVSEVDVFYAPEPDSAFLAVLLARTRGAKTIFDIHEVYHDEMLGRWVTGWSRTVAGQAVRLGLLSICAQSDLVLAVSRAVLEPYSRTGSRTMIVRNCAPTSFGAGAPADILASPQRMIVMHGKSTLSHGTPVVIEAVGLAAGTVPGLRAIMFDTFGAVPDGFGRDQFRATVGAHHIEKGIDLRRVVPMSEMAGILRGCDVGVVAYDRTWGVNSLPNKLFEYMGAGLPVIAPTYSTEIRAIVERERCGLLVDTERPREIADAFVHLHQNRDEAREMGRRGREAFLARHNWQVEVEPVLERIRRWVSP